MKFFRKQTKIIDKENKIVYNEGNEEQTPWVF